MQIEKNNTGSTQIVRGNGDSSDVPGTHSGWDPLPLYAFSIWPESLESDRKRAGFEITPKAHLIDSETKQVAAFPAGFSSTFSTTCPVVYLGILRLRSVTLRSPDTMLNCHEQ